MKTKVKDHEKQRMKELFENGYAIKEIGRKVKRAACTVRFHVYDRPKPKKAKEGFFDESEMKNWLINEY
jgi:hypothetical protein